MPDLAPFPDVEDVLAEALADLADTGSTYPADLQDRLTFVRVRRTGGADDRVSDHPLVDIETAAATRAAAWETARLVQQRLISGPLRAPDRGVVDRATTEIGLRAVLHENPAVGGCVLGTYRVSLRRPA